MNKLITLSPTQLRAHLEKEIDKYLRNGEQTGSHAHYNLHLEFDLYLAARRKELEEDAPF